MEKPSHLRNIASGRRHRLLSFRNPLLSVAAAAVLSVGLGSYGGPSNAQTASQPAFPATTKAAVDKAITKWLAEFKAPGVVVGLWFPNRGTYVVARGVSDLATGTPMKTDDHFRIGSITKTFTVTALLKLVDEKQVALDDPVSKYVNYVPNGKNVTLRMLANMTSGLFNYSADKGFVKKLLANPSRVWTPVELAKIGLAHPVDFAPNTGWNYSNTNTVLLGIIIQGVTHKPIRDLFASEIFKPLGLKNTVWPTDASLPTPYAHGITKQTPDEKQADATNWNPSWGFTAGQLTSTLGDLRVWVKSYTTGTLISPAMQKERLTWVTFPPNTDDRKYGLGIGNDHGWLGHSGELPGYNCGAYYLPSNGTTVVIMVNSDIPAGKANPMPALFKAIAQILTPDNVPA